MPSWDEIINQVESAPNGVIDITRKEYISKLAEIRGRNARRESIEALAGATKIPLSTLKRRLLNKSPFTLEEIEQIAKHFAVAASDLISPSIAIPALGEKGAK